MKTKQSIESLSGWISLIHGISVIDNYNDKKGEDKLKTCALEEYVQERRPDVLDYLRNVADNNKVSDNDLVDFLMGHPNIVEDTMIQAVSDNPDYDELRPL